MAQPAALYLTRFDASPGAEQTLDVAPVEVPAEAVVDPEAERAAMLAEARQAGLAEGLEMARAEAVREKQQLQSAFAEQLAAERQKWLREEGDVLSEKLATALQQMQDTLAESLGQVLRPFVEDALRRQMMSELAAHVADMAANPDTLAMTISGSPDVLAYLQAKLTGVALAIAYEPREGVDVKVVAGQTVIETRLKAWIDLINAQME